MRISKFRAGFAVSDRLNLSRMSEAGDDIPIEAPEEEQVEVTATDAPKGKLTVEEALQVRLKCFVPPGPTLTISSRCSKS